MMHSPGLDSATSLTSGIFSKSRSLGDLVIGIVSGKSFLFHTRCFPTNVKSIL